MAFWARASACTSSGRSAKKLTTSVSGFTASVDVMLDKAAFVVGTSMRPETLAASFHTTGKRLTALHWSLGWPHHWPGWECLWGQRVVLLRVSSARIGLLLHPWHSVPLLSMASLDAITLGVDHLAINRRCAAYMPSLSLRPGSGRSESKVAPGRLPMTASECSTPTTPP